MKEKNLITCIAAALAASLPLGGLSAAESVKPNIIIILADDMGWGDAGFNGCTDFPTPAIDSIAAGGVRFTQGYVMAPQCAPSRSALLTGKDQNRILANSNITLDIIGLPEMKTFADYLKAAGYRTGMVGKWHLGEEDAKHPTARGFDWFFGHRFGSSFYYPPPGRDSIPRLELGTQPVKVTQYLTDENGDRAVEFITNASPLTPEASSKPFFLYLSFNAPHTPMQAPEAEIAKFAHLKDKGKWRPTYAAMMTVMDRNIQRVLDALDAQGIVDNTIVIFLSDNGGPPLYGADNGPLRGFKGDTLEGGLRVPFAIKWPAKIKPGQTVDAPVLSIDLLPTALAAVGVPIPDDLEGVNLLPALTGGAEVPDRVLNFMFTLTEKPEQWWWAVRDGDWKLVHFDPRGADRNATETTLFNLKEDIGESKDLTAAHPEIRQRLQKLHDAWFNGLPAPYSNLTPEQFDAFWAKKRVLKSGTGKK